VPKSAETSLQEKLDFLLRPESFPDRPRSVQVIETHFAWVFLSRELVYKLKKPIRFAEFDFTTLAARRADCELEVALNRRLAEPTYLGVVPLGRIGGRLALEAPTDPVEWLVKMRRLPEDRMLDRAAARGAVGEPELVPLIDKLGAFYARTTRAAWDGPAYRETLLWQIDKYATQLASRDLGMDAARVRRLASAQRQFVREHPALFDERIVAGRVVDAHGDLRPEHVFLGQDPQIIDCLEFSAALRLLDTAEEIGFLVLECERLGFGEVGATVYELYRRRCDDHVAPELYAFYRSQRALVRALLSAWHLRDGLASDVAAHWRRRGDWYLDVACEAIGAPPRTAPVTLQHG
jgi:aminoglycoside phosphotransferase family enzyme